MSVKAAQSFLLALLFVVALFSGFAMPVKTEDFKSCDASGFCRRMHAFRNLVEIAGGKIPPPNSTSPPGDVLRKLLPPVTASVSKTNEKDGKTSPVAAEYCLDLNLPTVIYLPGADSQSEIVLCISAHASGAVRIRVHPKLEIPQNPAHVALDSRTADFPNLDYTLTPDKSENFVDISFATCKTSVRVYYSPLKIDILHGKSVAASFNAASLFRYELGGDKGASEAQKESVIGKPEEFFFLNSLDGAFDESFKSFADNKKRGPRAFSFDVTFLGTKTAYGLAEHATRLNLPSTRGEGARFSAPYRLFNLDVFEYLVESEMALYGHVPLLQSIIPNVGAAAIFTLNGAEMWVDIERDPNLGVLSHWMVETGPVDFFFLTGDTLPDVHKTYLQLTGKPYLPSVSSIGYHQCRWNYNDIQDVIDVNNNFNYYDIPYDYIWLDIEHTDHKKYFTWDPLHFRDPSEIFSALKKDHRFLVTINDPHILVENSYSVYDSLMEKKLFVATPDDINMPFEGNCWPGKSIWFDFLNKEARDLWSEQYQLAKYPHSDLSMFAWNDMNEPSVFNGPEITMPKNVLHMGGKYENRDVHNLYGMLMHMATYNGQLQRAEKATLDGITGHTERPFVLSRSFFAGSQRFGAVWTGDNMANWDHLKIVTPMLLSLSLCGISFAGADIGGFFYNPTAELMVRWYQVAVLQPFFRSHAHIETKRREPWVFLDELDTIRTTIQMRYKLLPTLYTAFAAATYYGETLMRPLFMEYSDDVLTHDQDLDYLVGGSGILVAPVVEAGAKVRSVYLPLSKKDDLEKGKNLWYQIFYTDSKVKTTKSSSGSKKNEFTVHKVHHGGQKIEIDATNYALPLFFSGGSIIFERMALRGSTESSLADDLSMIIVLDNNHQAQGRLYLDDGKTHGYVKRGEHLWISVSFSKNKLVGSHSHTSGLDQKSFTTKKGQRHNLGYLNNFVSKIVIHFPDGAKSAQIFANARVFAGSDDSNINLGTNKASQTEDKCPCLQVRQNDGGLVIKKPQLRVDKPNWELFLS